MIWAVACFIYSDSHSIISPILVGRRLIHPKSWTIFIFYFNNFCNWISSSRLCFCFFKSSLKILSSASQNSSTSRHWSHTVVPYGGNQIKWNLYNNIRAELSRVRVRIHTKEGELWDEHWRKWGKGVFFWDWVKISSHVRLDGWYHSKWKGILNRFTARGRNQTRNSSLLFFCFINTTSTGDAPYVVCAGLT